MGEKRESALCGKAQPITWFRYWRVTGDRSEPNPAKFEGKWYDGEEPDALDELQEKMHAKRKEDQAEYREKTGYKDDNISWTKYMLHTSEMKMPRPEAWPLFSDFTQMGYSIGFDRAKYTHYLLQQYNHCVGNLGEDHPTCRKAEWYYAKMAAPFLGNFYEEMGELGHWDTQRKWGVKARPSFLPHYQPVKKNIPGAYEFFRSKDYLDGYNPEGEGEFIYPIAYVE